VGCGGGLLCEPLARMGGLITGVDAVEKNLGTGSSNSFNQVSVYHS
jgi:2-polyprenyl-3-methyl-5-hydroxy-6-metoxy-1,4-benzoquinol methylase